MKQKNIYRILDLMKPQGLIYQFVWHSYCDWYIEFLKPIFDSKNIKNIQETRDVSAFIQANILILLHPFIPFFTEKFGKILNLLIILINL